MSKVVAVVGAGPGLGGAVALRFAKDGYAVALLSRTQQSTASTAEALTKHGAKFAWFSCDATDGAQVKTAFAAIKQQLGAPSVLVFNASSRPGSTPVLEVTEEQFTSAFRSQVLGLLYAAQAVLPDMIAAKQGVILVTGATASIRAQAKSSVFAASKHGTRALANSIAREHGPNGVHTVHIRIDCAIDSPDVKKWLGDKYTPDSAGSPEALADTYYWLAHQPRTGWTNEIDLRPARENWTC